MRHSSAQHHFGHGRTRDNEDARGRRISGTTAVQQARAHLLALTGQDCESVSALQRTHRGWTVQMETVELERIPRTTDIMASYLVELDEQGDLMSYERVERYYRNQATPAE